MLNRTKNAINNGIWGFISKVFSLLMPFIIRTMIIRIIGIEYLGLGSLFSSILSVLNMADLGFSSAIVFCMYKPIAENDDELVSAYLSLFRKIYNIIGIAIFIVGLCVIPFLDKLITGDVPNDINIYWLYLIYLCASSVTYLFAAYRNCLLYAYQRSDVINKISLVVHLLMYSLQIIFLWLYKNYYLYIILLPTFNVILNIITAYYSKKLFPTICARGKLSKGHVKDLQKRVSGLALLKVSYVSRNAFDSIVISTFLGLESVAIYNNYYYISTAVSGFLVIILNSITAGLGNSVAIDSVEKNERDMKVINFLYLCISCICYCCFVSLYQPFMELWVGKSYLFPDIVMILFSVYFLVERSENVISIYYDVCGLWWKGKWKGIIEAIVNILLNILLCRYFGVTGVVVATIITVLFVSIPSTSYYLYKYYFKQNYINFVLKQYASISCFLIIGLIVYLANRIWPNSNIMFQQCILMGVRLVISVAISTAAIWVVFKKTDIYRISLEWFINHLKVLKR